MPRRDIQLTVALGDGPGTSPAGSWDKGIAVAADGNDLNGMIKGKVAVQGDDIIGWTIRPQVSGDIATLRTMFDGTIEAKIGPLGATAFEMSQPLLLCNDDSGRVTPDFDSSVKSRHFLGYSLESGKVENELCEVYVFIQKNIINNK